MAVLFSPYLRAADQANEPIPGAFLSFYKTGTSTLQPIWAEYTLSIALTNPIQADGNGVWPAIWLDDSLPPYKVVMQYPDVTNPSIPGATVSGPNGTLDPYNAALIPTPDPAEVAAGITPLDFDYPPGHTFRYMTADEQADVTSGALTKDVSGAINNAINTLLPVTLGLGYHGVKNTVTTNNLKNVVIRGTPYKSQIVNINTADPNAMPTLKIVGSIYFEFSDFVIGGRAGMPNHGVIISSSGSQVAFGVFNDIILQPNGNGIEFQKCNTIQLNRVHYWPSNGIGGIGNTNDVGRRKYAAFSNSSISGNFANEITFNACNMTGVDSTISGYASIDMRAPGLGGAQVVRLIDCELENTPINLYNLYNPQIDGCYVDRCVITFDHCRYGHINDSYNAKTIAMVSCVNVIASNLAQGVAADSLTIDAGCVNCGVYNFSGVGVTDAGTNSTLINWNLQGVVQPDKLNIRGWITPAFSAGVFTASGSMTWTVSSGQALNYRYTLDGKTMTVAWTISGSTVGGTPSTALQVAIPAGKLAASRIANPCHVLNNAVHTAGQAQVTAGASVISIFTTGAGANYVAGTTDTDGQLTFDIQ